MVLAYGLGIFGFKLRGHCFYSPQVNGIPTIHLTPPDPKPCTTTLLALNSWDAQGSALLCGLALKATDFLRQAAVRDPGRCKGIMTVPDGFCRLVYVWKTEPSTVSSEGRHMLDVISCMQQIPTAALFP